MDFHGFSIVFKDFQGERGQCRTALRPVAILAQAILAQGDVAVDELEGVLEKTAAIAQAAL